MTTPQGGTIRGGCGPRRALTDASRYDAHPAPPHISARIRSLRDYLLRAARWRFWTFHALRVAFASVAKSTQLQPAYGRACITGF
jgi:hypothetical protein